MDDKKKDVKKEDVVPNLCLKLFYEYTKSVDLEGTETKHTLNEIGHTTSKGNVKYFETILQDENGDGTVTEYWLADGLFVAFGIYDVDNDHDYGKKLVLFGDGTSALLEDVCLFLHEVVESDIVQKRYLFAKDGESLDVMSQVLSVFEDQSLDFRCVADICRVVEKRRLNVGGEAFKAFKERIMRDIVKVYRMARESSLVVDVGGNVVVDVGGNGMSNIYGSMILNYNPNYKPEKEIYETVTIPSHLHGLLKVRAKPGSACRLCDFVVKGYYSTVYMYRCRKCDFDYCEECVKKEQLPEDIRCPSCYEGYLQYTQNIVNYICANKDSCVNKIEVLNQSGGLPSLGCTNCNYRLCLTCAGRDYIPSLLKEVHLPSAVGYKISEHQLKNMMCRKCGVKKIDCMLLHNESSALKALGHIIYCTDCSKSALENEEDCPICGKEIVRVAAYKVNT